MHFLLASFPPISVEIRMIKKNYKALIDDTPPTPSVGDRNGTRDLVSGEDQGPIQMGSVCRGTTCAGSGSVPRTLRTMDKWGGSQGVLPQIPRGPPDHISCWELPPAKEWACLPFARFPGQTPGPTTDLSNWLTDFPNQILLFYGEFGTLACFLPLKPPLSLFLFNCRSNIIKTAETGAEGAHPQPPLSRQACWVFLTVLGHKPR